MAGGNDQDSGTETDVVPCEIADLDYFQRPVAFLMYQALF